MNTIAGEWDRFKNAVIPSDAPPVQLQEMRRSFYAGAESMLRLQYAIGNDSVSDNAGVALLQSWHDECRLFAQEVADGKA